MSNCEKNSLDFVIELVKQPTVTSICLFRPIMTRPIQKEAKLSHGEEALISEALSLRETVRFPFWDCLMGLGAKRSDLSDRIIELASRHNSQGLSLEMAASETVNKSSLATRIASLSPGQVLALSSKVKCQTDATLHIPMLDFHCEASMANDDLAIRIVKKLGMNGYLAHSGQSYHFYGTSLISEEEMVSFLARALLFAPIVDRAWIAHQLIERACGLRISPGKNYKTCPEIFAQV